jgi:acyl carrier protein
LVLMSRSGASPDDEERLAELEALGATIVVAKGDVARETDVIRVLAEIDASLPPLRGVIHAAGVIDDGAIFQQSWERFETVMAPKVQGAWNLHRYTLDHQLDFFVLFSSMSSVIGSAGQSNYAAANAYMDALAHYRRANGLWSLSINWGPWSEVGMAASLDAAYLSQWRSLGVDAISPVQGELVFEQLLHQDQPQVAVFPVNWAKFLSLPHVDRENPFLEALFEKYGRRPLIAPAASLTDIYQRCVQAGDDARTRLLTDHLQKLVSGVLQLTNGAVLDVHKPLNEFGLDSLMAFQLKNQLDQDLRINLPVHHLIEGKSVADVVDVLAGLLADDSTSAVGDAGRDPKVESELEMEAQQARNLLQDLDDLPDDEIDRLLGNLLI